MTAPRDLRADLRSVIERRILAHPRSAQLQIGPSEVGTPCDRKLAHKLAGTPRVRPESAAWRPTVGTAVHSWLEAAFTADNAALGWDRWLLEYKVTGGDINGVGLTGHADLYDCLTNTVVDWKIPGPGSLKLKKAAHSPGPQYRVQAHLYGRGFAIMGLDVERVAIFFLPAAGELADAYYWSEAYDEQVALDALARADGIAIGLASLGADLLIPQLAPTPDYCSNCAWWKPGTDVDLRVGCPGIAVPPRSVPTGPAFGPVNAPTERRSA